MEKSNFTFNGFFRILSLFLLLGVFGSQNIYAQCSLGVNTNTQISLDQNCQALITPEIVLNDQTTTCPGGIFSVNVQTLNGVNIPGSPVVTGAYINQTLIAQVVDAVSGNTGWGYIHIEDKLAPVILCSDVTVSCSNIASFTPTVVDACDPNPTVTLISQSEQLLPCDVDFIKRITRVYRATDNQGNVSSTCTQVITVERIDLDAILYPIDIQIQCDANYPVDANGRPAPSYTGVPTLNGNSIFPTTDLGCNTVVTYSDLVLPSINGVQKIMREWIVNEWWCNGSNMDTDIQLIEIIDNQGPVISNCPSNYTASTTPGTDCQAMVLLPALTAVDACGTVGRIDVTYPGGFLSNKNGGLVLLNIGVNQITYTVYDNNNNSSQCTFTITVSDNTAPVVVCDQNTVVSLALDGTAYVYAQSFDDGSYDDCSAITFTVRRMDNGGSCSFAPNFGPTVLFCCDDVSATNNVIVILRATDANGNFNDCMVNVQVQDKLPPAIVCPASLTVACDFPYDLDNLAATFGTATAQDNCSTSIVELAPQVVIDMCREGYILRTFTASDPNGSVSCTQIITFENFEPFDANDIVYPADITINDCIDPTTLHPDQTGYPVLTEDACDNVGFDWSDKTFTVINGNGACFKIIRTWEIVDWCNKVGNQFVSYTGQQVIMVINTVPPGFTGDYSDKVECTFDNNCANGFIELSAAAEDACTPELVWVYRVDLDNNGSFDIISPTSVAVTVNASGTYPVGNHRIVYTAEDGCGNAVSQTQLFSIVNCKLPTPYCINGLAITLMPIDQDGDGEVDFGMVETWASDFDAGSFHSCGLPVTVSFSADPTDTRREFNCDNLGDNTLQIWANVILPNGVILQDFCTTNVNIQANNGSCDGTTTSTLVVIDGDIKDEMKNSNDNVNVVLQGSEFISSTNFDGHYSFPAMATGGIYELIPNKVEDDHLNGITTLDIIIIQKHILGLELLNSPYKVIAADVNNDEKISGADIIALRKLILGKYISFPNNTDWRFVDATYKFINPEMPLNEEFNETYVINNLASNMKVDFVSVKVGDLNNSAKVNFTSNTSEARSNTALQVNIQDVAYKAGQEVKMEMTLEEAISLLGMQYTLKYNDMYLDFNRIESNVFNVDLDANLNTNHLAEGMLSISVSEAREIALTNEDILFTVYFTAKKDGQISGNVQINSELAKTEAYDSNLEIMDMEINFRNNAGQAIESSPFALFQNVPNPFDNATNISFNLPNSTNVKMSIFDVSGKLIYTQSGAYSKGMNTITLNVNDFAETGVLYYQIETTEYTATRKMVVLK